MIPKPVVISRLFVMIKMKEDPIGNLTVKKVHVIPTIKTVLINLPIPTAEKVPMRVLHLMSGLLFVKREVKESTRKNLSVQKMIGIPIQKVVPKNLLIAIDGGIRMKRDRLVKNPLLVKIVVSESLKETIWC